MKATLQYPMRISISEKLSKFETGLSEKKGSLKFFSKFPSHFLMVLCLFLLSVSD